MEVRFKRIMEQLEEKKNTHPHLVQLWKSYMKIKNEKFLQYCSSCESIIERMHTESDIEPEMIITLFILMSNYTQLT